MPGSPKDESAPPGKVFLEALMKYEGIQKVEAFLELAAESYKDPKNHVSSFFICRNLQVNSESYTHSLLSNCLLLEY